MPHLIVLLIALSAVMLNDEPVGCVGDASFIATNNAHHEAAPSEVLWEVMELRDILQEKSSATDALQFREKSLTVALSRIVNLKYHLAALNKSYRGFRFPMLV